MCIPSYDKIANEGGVYDTKKYRYVIDPCTKDIKRLPLVYLDTTTALDLSEWKTVKTFHH